MMNINDTPMDLSKYDDKSIDEIKKIAKIEEEKLIQELRTLNDIPINDKNVISAWFFDIMNWGFPK